MFCLRIWDRIQLFFVTWVRSFKVLFVKNEIIHFNQFYSKRCIVKALNVFISLSFTNQIKIRADCCSQTVMSWTDCSLKASLHSASTHHTHATHKPAGFMVVLVNVCVCVAGGLTVLCPASWTDRDTHISHVACEQRAFHLSSCEVGSGWQSQRAWRPHWHTYRC